MLPSSVTIYDIHSPLDVESILQDMETCLRELGVEEESQVFQHLPHPLQAALLKKGEDRQVYCELCCELDAGKAQLIAILRGMWERLQSHRH